MGRMALFYTTKSDARLSQRFGGLPLIKAAEMVCDLPEIKGMCVQSDSDAWFAADIQTLKHVVGQVRTSWLDRLVQHVDESSVSFTRLQHKELLKLELQFWVFK
jgi:hypothetical protein